MDWANGGGVSLCGSGASRIPVLFQVPLWGDSCGRTLGRADDPELEGRRRERGRRGREWGISTGGELVSYINGCGFESHPHYYSGRDSGAGRTEGTGGLPK